MTITSDPAGPPIPRRPARPRRRRLAHPLAFAVLCGRLLLAGMVHPALASADQDMNPPPRFAGPGGCDSVAPGHGWLCLWVDQDSARSDVFVRRIRTIFSPAGPSPAPVCDTHVELSYFRAGVQHTDLFDQFGCDPTGQSTADFALNTQLDLDSPICTRVRGPITGDQWTPRSCLTEHRDSTTFGFH